MEIWTEYDWFNVHCHSKYSARDGFGSPRDIVHRANTLGWPAVALTDYGTVAGVPELYTAAKDSDLVAIPGLEAFYLHDMSERSSQHPMHLTLLATTLDGWRNIVGMNNHAQGQSYKGKPLIDFADLSRMSDQHLLDGVTVGTGCRYGPVPRQVFSQVPVNAANVLLAFLQAFRGRVFVEVTHHNISEQWWDDDLMNTMLVALADEYAIPVIASADSHYIMKQDQPHHDFYKKIVAPHSKHPELVGDGYYMYSASEARTRFGDDLFFRSIGGLRWLMDGYDLSIPELDTFTIKVPQITRQEPDEVLRDKVGVDHDLKLTPREKKRLKHELEVISNAGFAPYMLLVAKLCEWMREQGILYSARGSASGSLVCYRLGITSVNPLFFKLRFDRFLSGDRLKPPDIDLDVDGQRREEVIDWLGANFSMLPIGAWSKLGMTDEQHGALLVKWKAWARTHGLDPETPDALTVRSLMQLSKYKPYGATTVHAAGVVVVDDDSVLNMLPTQYITSSDTYVTAFDGDVIDQLGYVKIDVLSVSMLTAVAKAIEWADINLDEIPWRDTKVFRRIAKGNTHSLFQLGGYTQRQGCMDLKPTKFDDLVAAMALFRPAVTASESGQRNKRKFIKSRHQKGNVADQLHPLLAEALKETYGVFIYQEQVMHVLRGLGMDPEELTAVLKAIKSSNANTSTARTTMNRVRDRVKKLLVAGEVPDTQHATFLEALSGYAEYGFNKSHAVAYARWAFVTAWLATHHPQAWWAAELSTCKQAEVPAAVAAAKKDGVQIRPPHVNHSHVDWHPEGKHGIRSGLTAIDDIGESTAAKIVANAPYEDLSDLCEKVNISGSSQYLEQKNIHALTGAVKQLVVAGALEGLT